MNQFKAGDTVAIINNTLMRCEGIVSDIELSGAGHYRYKLDILDKDAGVYPDYLYEESDLILVKRHEDLRLAGAEMNIYTVPEPIKGGTKHDKGKPDLSLVDVSLVSAAARALGFGANKYGRNNYKKGIETNRIYASLLRHIFARMSGENLDPESGLDHIDHIAANVQFLAYYNDEEAVND